jgi:ADP-heptose:LPS heptosyltransferase
VPITSTDWEYLSFPQVKDQVKNIFGFGSEGLRIGLHPFSGNPIRNWMLGRWAVLGRELIKDFGTHLVITGGDADRDSAEWLRDAIGDACDVAAGAVSLVDTWVALKELDLVISVDTGMIHMAAAGGVPVISLFGPGDPAIWGPRGQLNRVIQRFSECQRCKGGRCVQPKVYCMEAISVDDVLGVAEDILHNNSDVMTTTECEAK